MNRRFIVAGLGALLVVGSVGHAQDPRLARKLDPQTLVAVEALIDSARAVGLPTEPLADRAFQGALKGASGALIVEQVRKRATQLATAKAALFPATDREMLAGADALGWGVPQATLTQLRQVRAGSDLTVPVSVLADLVGRGVQLDTASADVIALESTNVRDADMIKFRQTVERDIALGSLPGPSVTTRAETFGIGNDMVNPGTTSANAPPRAPNTPSPKPPIKP